MSEYVSDVVVTEPLVRRTAILDVIKTARRSIALSLFRCNDADVFDALAQATARGVQVEALITPRVKGGKEKIRKLWQRLEASGASVHAYSDPVVKYHAKYLVADDGPAIVASCNFTRKCFERTCDAVVVTHDPEVVAGLRALLAADIAGRPLPASLTPRLIVGPERARRQVTTLIEQARSSVRVIDAKLSDPDVVMLLKARRAAGVNVQVLGAKRFGALKSHAKILLIDDRVAVVGALAIAAMSLDFRREVAIVLEEAAAVSEIDRLFRSLHAIQPVEQWTAGGEGLRL